jgi:hypothetical protein
MLIRILNGGNYPKNRCPQPQSPSLWDGNVGKIYTVRNPEIGFS